MSNTPDAQKPRRRNRAKPETPKPVPNAFVLNEQASRPRFGFLDDTAIEELKSRAFDLLENYGVIVIHPVASKALKKAGAKDGSDTGRLRLPRALVEEALKAAPKEVSLYGKKPEFDMHLPRTDGGFVMRTGTGGHGYVNPETGAYRNLDLAAAAEIAAVANGLDEVGFIAHPFVYGVPETTADIHSFGEIVKRTHKHQWMQPYAKENVEFLMRLAAIGAGGEAELCKRPTASCITCSFSPLEFKYMDTEAIIQCGKFGLPIHACSLPSAGGTAPLSTPGLVLMAAAEILTMVTIASLVSPGTPVIATPLMFTLDMRTGSALQSCPETLQAASMAVQLMKHGFGLPTHTYGSGADTPDVDVQSMAERALLGQNVVLSGVDIMGGIGQLECATVFSPVQAVLDNEVGTMLRKFIQPPEITDQSLNWSELSSIRGGGHFLDSKHTLELCREQYQPKAFMRQDRDGYEAAKRYNALDQSRDMALELISAAPKEGVLNEDTNREIAQLISDADRFILDSANSGATSVI